MLLGKSAEAVVAYVNYLNDLSYPFNSSTPLTYLTFSTFQFCLSTYKWAPANTPIGLPLVLRGYTKCFIYFKSYLSNNN